MSSFLVWSKQTRVCSTASAKINKGWNSATVPASPNWLRVPWIRRLGASHSRSWPKPDALSHTDDAHAGLANSEREPESRLE